MARSTAGMNESRLKAMCKGLKGFKTGVFAASNSNFPSWALLIIQETARVLSCRIPSEMSIKIASLTKLEPIKASWVSSMI